MLVLSGWVALVTNLVFTGRVDVFWRRGSVRVHTEANAVAEETLAFVLSTLGARSGMFYWADESPLGMRGVIADRHQLIAHSRYRGTMYRQDPLNVGRMRRLGTRAAILTQHVAVTGNRNAPLFFSYLRGFGFRDVLELMFWHNDTPVAGISVTEDNDEEGLLARGRHLISPIHRYVEFNVGRFATLTDLHKSASENITSELSPRETEVALLICAGLTNRDISEQLAVSLATTKTHVRSIFDKVGVENRTSLVALLIGRRTK